MKYKRVYRGIERVGDQYMGNKSVNPIYGPDNWTTVIKTSGYVRIELNETLIYRRPITLGKRQTRAANKRSPKRAKPRIGRVR